MHCIQREMLEQRNAEQQRALEEAQRTLQEMKDKREEIKQDIDRMKEETAAWYYI